MKRPGLIFALLPATLFGLTSLHAADTAPSPAIAADLAAANSVAKVERAPENLPAPRALTAAEMLKRFDKNGDGKLDEDERAEAHEMMLQETMNRQALVAATGGAEELRKRALEMFDKNHDGKLDDEERAAARKYVEEHGGIQGVVSEELKKRFDKNGDGKLDEAERAQLQQFLQNRKGKAGPGGVAMRQEILRRYDHNGDGKIDDAEWAELEPVMRQRIESAPMQLRRYDKNGDGKLDDGEWAAAVVQIRAFLNTPASEGGAKVTQAKSGA